MENLLYNDRSEVEKNFIKEVCSYILKQWNGYVDTRTTSKEFCGIFVEGRDRQIDTLEDITSLYSFKVFSKYDYPIFCFINNKENFLTCNKNPIYYTFKNIYIIEIPPLNSLEEYTEFCIKKLYHLLPDWVENVITLQSDGMLLKRGWEDYILNGNFDWLSPHWRHMAHIDIYIKALNFKGWSRAQCPSTCIGNGGFSFRKASKMRKISRMVGNLTLKESGREDNRIPMEDLFYTYWGFGYGIMKKPTLKECDIWAQDPLDSNLFNQFKEGKKHFYGFHFMKETSEWPECNHE